ncbi:baseplate J/gp47 family protein [Mucilaginibacter sp.]|uniref:baseplate J/gp47 family protein n=1 Tax=Mucilaginibacter sp. TaxID=1882438 RepID=UPI0025D48E39|nr:baseplate J/gp47 family protein [Mucilaginibacter sp.]
MSTKAIDYKIILKRDGQTQQQRMPQLLDPALVPVDQRSKEDLYKYVQKIASLIKFYDLNPATQKLIENGAWNNFFDKSIEELNALAANASLPPHIALLDCFFELMDQPKALMNTLTKRHLDFYYQQVLMLGKKAPVPDNAHVIFELKKNTEDTLLTAGTALLAGKDATKKDLNYVLTHDIVVNQSKVAQLKSLYVNPVNKNYLHYAPIANSKDGLGAVLDPTNPKWNGFGNSSLPLAQVGFCLASDILMMKEGNRNVTVNLTVRNLDVAAKNAVLTANLFKISITGEKGWIGPKLSSATITSADNQVFNVQFTFNITKDEPAVIAYNKASHGSDFDTTHPILQVLVNTDKYDFGYRNLVNAELIDSTIEVNVTGISSLSLENDFGTLNAKKPFTPFGPLSDKNSNFYIGHQETFSKRLKEFSLDVDWKNIPDSDLASYYINYNQSNNGNGDFNAVAAFKDGFTWQEQHKSVQLFNTANAQAATTWKFSNPAFPVLFPLYILPQFVTPYYINPGHSILQTVTSKMSYLLPGFSNLQAKTNFVKAKASLTLQLYKPVLQLLFDVYRDIRKGQVQLRLDHSFLFKDYREKYTAEILRFSRDGGTLKLPSEPFAPEIQSITLNYTATTAKINFSGTTLNDYINEEIEFFQYGAFGQMREHAYTRSKHDFLNNTLVKLVPEHIDEGSLQIGLSGLYAEDSVCMLFQAAEGSANPDKPKIDISWSVLCDNYWKTLSNEDFIFDTTNGLLTSGVIKIVVPPEATTSNTILANGLLWFKAAIKNDSDGVCNLLDVQSNAAISSFNNQDNDPQHLVNAMPPNTITKLKNDNGNIKKVTQPYSSFGGHLIEDDQAYYIRVSERLRHKERSVAIWDYERMILNHFPTVHKVKCINHATPTSFYAPGNILMIVVPDLTNRNAVDPFKPKVDKNTLDQINTFLTQHSSAWAQFQVMNPLYEAVKVSVKVKLKRGYEFNYYEKIIDQKLQGFLSPWIISDGGNDLHFGGKVTKSMIIKFLEDLEYIDYLTDFSLYKYSPNRQIFGRNVEVAEASSPASILVSAMHHDIIND